MADKEQLVDLIPMLRLEIARRLNGLLRWCLVDWIKRDDLTGEMQRVLARFNRIGLSLARQSSGKRAKNEPYAEVIGVRCKMGPRVIGIWPKNSDELNLLNAPTASADEWHIEREFERQGDDGHD